MALDGSARGIVRSDQNDMRMLLVQALRYLQRYGETPGKEAEDLAAVTDLLGPCLGSLRLERGSQAEKVLP